MEAVARNHGISTYQIIRIKRSVTLDPYIPRRRELVNLKVKYRGMLVVCETMADVDRLAEHAATTWYKDYDFKL